MSSQLTEALKLSQCMRAHGITGFPDPRQTGSQISITMHVAPGSNLNPHSPQYLADPNGQGMIIVAAGPGIDPTSPLFQRAQRACQNLDHGFNIDTSNFPS